MHSNANLSNKVQQYLISWSRYLRTLTMQCIIQWPSRGDSTRLKRDQIISPFSNLINRSDISGAPLQTIDKFWGTDGPCLTFCIPFLLEETAQLYSEFMLEATLAESPSIFFICALNKRLSKKSWGWWFETPSRSLWRHCNGVESHLFHGNACT